MAISDQEQLICTMYINPSHAKSTSAFTATLLLLYVIGDEADTYMYVLYNTLGDGSHFVFHWLRTGKAPLEVLMMFHSRNTLGCDEMICHHRGCLQFAPR